jgi:phage terminase large subunit
VYGLGETGKIEGLVHPSFSLCDEIPSGGIVFYGMDFGFSNDPCALVKCVLRGEDLFCDQLIYERGLLNSQVARRFEQLGITKNNDEIFADSAEPKSIAEIRSYGYNIKGAIKGPDSIRASISKINEYRHHWTKRSIDAIKEQRNYRYITNGDGKITEKPIDDFDHAMQARWYAVMGKLAHRPATGFNRPFL